MRDLYIKNGRGFLVIFSLTSWQSFLDVRTIREQILRVKGTDNVPICLIGNKCDASLQRQVTPDDALALAQAWTCPYLETSAKLPINVNDTFAEIVREINMRTKTKRKSTKAKYSLSDLCCACCSSSSSWDLFIFLIAIKREKKNILSLAITTAIKIREGEGFLRKVDDDHDDKG